MNWNLNIYGSPQTSGNQLIAAVYDPSNPSSYPNSPVAYQAIASGFPGPFNVTLSGLNAIVYNFVLWENTTGTPGGTARNTFSLQPTIQTLQVRTDLYLTTGSTPGMTAGSNTYTDSSLAGWTYSLEQKGLGTLQSGVEYTSTSTSWTLAAGTFNNGQQFILHFLPIVSNQPITTTTSNIVSAIRIVSANPTSLTNSDMGKDILLQGAATDLVVNLPAISTVSDYASIYFNSAGGSHINAVLAAAGSDAFQFNLAKNQVTPTAQLILGQSESLCLMKANGIWNIISGGEGMLRVGELVWNYSNQQMNTLALNGAQGLLRSDYPRLWNWINSLASGVVISAASWAATSTYDGVTYYINKGRFNFGDGSATFGLPDLTGTGFLRAVRGSRVPGDFEVDIMMEHKHDSLIGKFPGSPNGNGPSKTVGEYNGTTTNNSDLSDFPGAIISGTYQLLTRVGSETRPQNNSAYLSIRI